MVMLNFGNLLHKYCGTMGEPYYNNVVLCYYPTVVLW